MRWVFCWSVRGDGFGCFPPVVPIPHDDVDLDEPEEPTT